MCRLGRDGVNDKWTPVKMVDLLQEMLPGIALHLDEMVEMMSMIGDAQRLQSSDEPRRAMMHAALVSFGEELARTHDGSTSVEELSEAGLLGPEQCDSYEDLKKTPGGLRGHRRPPARAPRFRGRQGSRRNAPGNRDGRCGPRFERQLPGGGRTDRHCRRRSQGTFPGRGDCRDLLVKLHPGGRRVESS
jgi:hypothetical protein